MLPKFTFSSAFRTIAVGIILCLLIALFEVSVVKRDPLTMAVTDATIEASTIIVLWGVFKLVVASAVQIMRPKLPPEQSALPEIKFDEAGTWPPAPKPPAGGSVNPSG